MAEPGEMHYNIPLEEIARMLREDPKAWANALTSAPHLKQALIDRGHASESDIRRAEQS